jgi:hypothetical protein
VFEGSKSASNTQKVRLKKKYYFGKKIKSTFKGLKNFCLFGIAFEESKSVFNTQKVCLKKKKLSFSKKIKSTLRVQKA